MTASKRTLPITTISGDEQKDDKSSECNESSLKEQPEVIHSYNYLLNTEIKKMAGNFNEKSRNNWSQKSVVFLSDPVHFLLLSYSFYRNTMKYLEVPTLTVLSSKLNQATQSDMRLNCRIELYSCEYRKLFVTRR